MKYIVYILKSSKDGGYYYGYTSDLDARLMRHNDGLVRSCLLYTSYTADDEERVDPGGGGINKKNNYKSIDGYNWLKENKIT